MLLVPGGALYTGNALSVLQSFPDESAHCCVTSPPYWGLRDYGVVGQLGLERTPEEYVSRMVGVFREVRRVLRDDGTLWLNIGDSYNAQLGQRKTTDAAGPKQRTNEGAQGAPSRNVPNLKPKDLVGIPWLLAFALRADGWYLRSEIIWAKPNPMPESVTDRPTKSHEQIFLLAKSERYYYDAGAISEPCDPKNSRDTTTHRREAPPGSKTDAGFVGGRHFERRNKRSVWHVSVQPTTDAHFATFPEALIRPCVLAGCPAGGTVLDPFSGAGTTALIAKENGRKFVGIELNPAYNEIAARRLSQEVFDFTAHKPPEPSAPLEGPQ